MKIKINNKEFELEVRESNGIRGLMFRFREKSPALLFNANGSLHSLFVFFPFAVLWLDDENNVVDKRIVQPWKFHVDTKTNYSKIIEIPLSRRYKKVINFIVGERFKKNNAS